MAKRIIRVSERVKFRISVFGSVRRLGVTALLVAVAPLLFSCGSEQESAEDTSPPLLAVTIRAELLSMMYEEQAAREVLDSVVAEKGWNSPEGRAASREEDRIDSANQVRLQEIVAEYGWPGKSLVGAQAALGAFLILQHADLSLQQEYLPMFEAATEKGEVEPTHLAMLQDRILRRQNQQQIYGTQLWNDPSTGELGLYPVRDSANVDVRRDSVGLGPIGDYLRSFGIDPDTMTPPIEIHVTPSDK